MVSRGNTYIEQTEHVLTDKKTKLFDWKKVLVVFIIIIREYLRHNIVLTYFGVRSIFLLYVCLNFQSILPIIIIFYTNKLMYFFTFTMGVEGQ